MCAGSQESDSSQTAKKDMLAALRARQEALEETLRQRIEELKSICIREAVRHTHTHAMTQKHTPLYQIHHHTISLLQHKLTEHLISKTFLTDCNNWYQHEPLVPGGGVSSTFIALMQSTHTELSASAFHVSGADR